ncbi:DNA polymerase III subunit gamma/tau [Paenibacillus sp. UMB4589-SE434]|uniref:DNA polymerase III subunit gamma/tau n=1 Tax=Paenibacillus sp. UMB4589-SE434 TaxID=3046314 RepID=UPI00254F3D2A|nr:DNA polymerase III subunit gamma/tau [Paenibacillus sp. UMB4589-SE434]MDK8184003.1 DNA polymerase III subunit gamma/tau [Paenibacillus sp. UMB4589-SE434]
MTHIALYRAWRPQSFQEMVGQKHIIQTLQNSLRERRFSHAYLFNGPRGTGKTSAAKILAKAVNCEHGPGPEPCNECEACRRITTGAVMDVVEIDAASNRGVEEIRDLREKVKYAPTEVRYKVYIIDEVHMLTTEAFNALLKTLEEPPAHVMFILATTEPHRLPATIISRCQRFDFRRVSLEEQVERLEQVCRQEEITADGESLEYIAKLSDGGMRDALSLLDQAASFTDGQVTYQQVLDITGGMPEEQFAKLAVAVRDQDVAAVLTGIEQLMLEGKSADKCMESLLYFFRDLLMLKLVPNGDRMTDRMTRADDFKELAHSFATDRIFSIIDALNRYQTEMKYAVQPQTLFEVALLHIAAQQQGAEGSKESNQETAGASSGKVDGLVQQLQRQITSLETKLNQLMKSGVPTASSAAEASPSERAAVRQAARPSVMAKKPPQFDRYVSSHQSPDFGRIRGQWGLVLQKVKEAGVTIHAWLVNGEPISALEDSLLLGFKNSIHRDTTEKPANKQVIERVLQDVLGKPYRMDTMMLKDWEAAVDTAEEAPIAFQLEPEGEQGGAREPWIDEAIQMFGEDLVIIKD